MRSEAILAVAQLEAFGGFVKAAYKCARYKDRGLRRYSHATNTRSDQALKSAFGGRFQRVEAPSHWGSLSTHLGFSPAGRP
jgi:hypothetical protein